jgi:hypothetical protein
MELTGVGCGAINCAVGPKMLALSAGRARGAPAPTMYASRSWRPTTWPSPASNGAESPPLADDVHRTDRAYG